MGTRHLIAVEEGGEYKVAQYGQWDGYPKGQGVVVLNFLRHPRNLEKLRAMLPKVRFFDSEGRDKEFVDSFNKNAEKGDNHLTPEQKYWWETFATRNVGGKILQNIADSKLDEILLKNEIGFAGDSLFCEYAYVIDLDKNVLEVYKGFNETRITKGRFKSGDKALEKSGKYEPIVLVKKYDINNLPDNETFVDEVDPPEEEE